MCFRVRFTKSLKQHKQEQLDKLSQLWTFKHARPFGVVFSLSFRVASCCCSVDCQVLKIVGNRGFSGPEKGIRARGFRACVPSVCFKVRLFLRPFGSETNVFITALTAKHHKQVIVWQVQPTLNVQARVALWSCLLILVLCGIMLLLCGLPGTKHCRQPWSKWTWKRQPGKRLPGVCPKCVFQGSFVLTTSLAANHHKQVIVWQVETTVLFLFASRTGLWFVGSVQHSWLTLLTLLNVKPLIRTYAMCGIAHECISVTPKSGASTCWRPLQGVYSETCSVVRPLDSW